MSIESVFQKGLQQIIVCSIQCTNVLLSAMGGLEVSRISNKRGDLN